MKKFSLILIIIPFVVISCHNKTNSSLPDAVFKRTIETFYVSDSLFVEYGDIEKTITMDYDKDGHLLSFLEQERGKDTALFYKIKDGKINEVYYKGKKCSQQDPFTWKSDVMNLHFSEDNLVEEIENMNFDSDYAFSMIFQYDEDNLYTNNSTEVGYMDAIDVKSEIHKTRYDKDKKAVTQEVMTIKGREDVMGNAISPSRVSYSKGVIKYLWNR